MRVLSIDHAHSFAQQGTRWINIDPGRITSIRGVRLHPIATHKIAVEIRLKPYGYSVQLALPLPWADWETIIDSYLLRK